LTAAIYGNASRVPEPPVFGAEASPGLQFPAVGIEVPDLGAPHFSHVDGIVRPDRDPKRLLEISGFPLGSPPTFQQLAVGIEFLNPVKADFDDIYGTIRARGDARLE